MTSIFAKECTRFEVEEKIHSNAYAILPVGACEQHGPHLPIGTDTYLAEYYSEKIASKINALIFPSVSFGYSWVWKELPGTLTLSQETFNHLLVELMVSLIGKKKKKILIVNGHDSNCKGLRYAARDIRDKYPEIQVLIIFYPNMNDLYAKYMESEKWHGMFHAEEWETSLMLSAKEELVHMEKAVCEYPQKPPLYGLDSSSLSTLSHSGIFGDATVATKEKGDNLIAELTDYLVDLLGKTNQ